eukprot:SAG31_NODE_640_length_13322_cov_4.396703_16_plen_337_part_00
MALEELMEVEAAIATQIAARKRVATDTLVVAVPAAATSRRAGSGVVPKIRQLGTSFARNSQRLVSEWMECEVGRGSKCSCFAWTVEKSVRDMPASNRASAELSPMVQQLCNLAWQALESSDAQNLSAALGTAAPAATGQLYLYLYEQQQCQRLSLGELTFLLDAMTPAVRHEVQLGPLLRSINSRSCPAARRGADFDTIAEQPYCQICHKVGNVRRCEGCGLVAYCSPEHREEDRDRHPAWCDELLFSRVLQGVFRQTDYYRLSRVPPPRYKGNLLVSVVQTPTSSKLFWHFDSTDFLCLSASAIAARLVSLLIPRSPAIQMRRSATAGQNHDGGE